MRYLMTFSYDGTLFYGYQKQKNKRTVQDEIENVLSKINNKKISISASGRTDAGVHAINQKAHFDSPNEYNLDRLKHSMNKMLPDDIYIKDIKLVDDDFHARFNVTRKKYVYKINVGEYNPLDRNYIYQYNWNLNVKKMSEAIKYFKGTHNFKSVTKTLKEEKDYNRTIYGIDLSVDNGIISIAFVGSGFMRYMVRNMVGLLIAVGEEKIEPSDIKEILEKEDRVFAKKTAPSEGLYLYDVYYD